MRQREGLCQSFRKGSAFATPVVVNSVSSEAGKHFGLATKLWPRARFPKPHVTD